MLLLHQGDLRGDDWSRGGLGEYGYGGGLSGIHGSLSSWTGCTVEGRGHARCVMMSRGHIRSVVRQGSGPLMHAHR